MKPFPRLSIGQQFRLADDAAEDYDLDPTTVYTVSYVADHYVPAAEYFRNPAAHPGGHPGYDAGSGFLYEADGLNCAVYSYEIEPLG